MTIFIKRVTSHTNKKHLQLQHIISQLNTKGRFHQPLCAKQKVVSAKRLAKKALQFHQRADEICPIMYGEIRQINSPFV